MTEKTPSEDRFNWHLPFYAAAGALILFLPIAIYSYDIGELLYIFVAAPIIALVLFVIAIRSKGRQRISILSMLVIYCAVSWGLAKNYYAVRTASRWFLLSKSYKAKVLAQPSTPNGELRHIEWDGWGGFGAGDTVVYLVFDPNDSLSTAAKSRASGKFNGIPCEVPPVRRLESHWYAVMFYTDTAWDQCA